MNASKSIYSPVKRTWMFNSKQPKVSDVIKQLRNVPTKPRNRHPNVCDHLYCKNTFGIRGTVCYRHKCNHFLKSVPIADNPLSNMSLPLFFL